MPPGCPKARPRKPRADAQRKSDPHPRDSQGCLCSVRCEHQPGRGCATGAQLAAAEREFGESMPPAEALRAWMLLFVDYIATKQIITPALNNIVRGPSKLFETTGVQIKGAINALVKRAIESGDIRPAHRGFQRGLRGWIGRKAPKDWCTFSFSARVRSPRPLTNFPNPFGCRQPVSA
jgi:hypothetical protein